MRFSVTSGSSCKIFNFQQQTRAQHQATVRPDRCRSGDARHSGCKYSCPNGVRIRWAAQSGMYARKVCHRWGEAHRHQTVQRTGAKQRLQASERAEDIAERCPAAAVRSAHGECTDQRSHVRIGVGVADAGRVQSERRIDGETTVGHAICKLMQYM